MLNVLEPPASPGASANLDRFIDNLHSVEVSLRGDLAGTSAALRDCRWELMALRADLERDQEPAEFTDAASLQAYLDQLKAGG